MHSICMWRMLGPRLTEVTAQNHTPGDASHIFFETSRNDIPRTQWLMYFVGNYRGAQISGKTSKISSYRARNYEFEFIFFFNASVDSIEKQNEFAKFQVERREEILGETSRLATVDWLLSVDAKRVKNGLTIPTIRLIEYTSCFIVLHIESLPAVSDMYTIRQSVHSEYTLGYLRCVEGKRRHGTIFRLSFKMLFDVDFGSWFLDSDRRYTYNVGLEYTNWKWGMILFYKNIDGKLSAYRISTGHWSIIECAKGTSGSNLNNEPIKSDGGDIDWLPHNSKNYKQKLSLKRSCKSFARTEKPEKSIAEYSID